MTLSENTLAGAPDMAVVVAAIEARRSLERCLEALAAACTRRRVEIIVVGSEGDSDLRAQLSSHSDLRFFAVENDALTPRMWAEGIANATAPIVALTTAHCFVTTAWCDAFAKTLHDSQAAACGGPLRLAPDASLVDAAIFFLRYSAYLEGKERTQISDIAGDNAAYVIKKIPPGSWDRSAGFWEFDVNRKLIESGNSIAWNEDAVVEFGQSFSLGSICHHRFEHGRRFGRERVARNESRAKIVVGFPAVPFALALRAWRRLGPGNRYRGAFLTSLPVMLVIGFCWAFGEAAGALGAGNANRS